MVGGHQYVVAGPEVNKFSWTNKQNIDTTRLITCSKHWERGREDRREGSWGGGGGRGVGGGGGGGEQSD